MHFSFIQISDTYIGPTRDFDYNGCLIETLEWLIDHLNQLPSCRPSSAYVSDVAHPPARWLPPARA
jgi:hypothetical protein